MDIDDADPLDSHSNPERVRGPLDSRDSPEPIAMNIDHLRKQAKNLQSIYPDLVAARGAKLSLAHAQDAIARTHGFPSWAAMVSKAASAPSETTGVVSGVQNTIGNLIRDGYRFVAGEETELAIQLDDNAEPTRFALGREVMLSFRKPRQAASVRREDEALDEFSERLGGLTGAFRDYTPLGLASLLAAARKAVERCPLYLDGWNRAAGALFTQGKFAEAMAIVEPVAVALLDLLPSEGTIQASYRDLSNRPFYRIVHCYLLLLHQAGRHREADVLAGRMYGLWPNDNIGFRFLLTRKARDAPG